MVAASLADLFRSLANGDSLTVTGPTAAAHQFAWLTDGWPLDRAMFCGDDALTSIEVDALVDDAVGVCPTAYGRSQRR